MTHKQHTCTTRGRSSCAFCMQLEGALWEAINRYTVTVGGDPSLHVYGNIPRMQAVADVSSVIRKLIAGPAITDAGIAEESSTSSGATPLSGLSWRRYFRVRGGVERRVIYNTSEANLMSDPNLSPPSPPAAPVRPEPRSAWLVMCVHCGQGTEAPLPFDHAGLSRFLAQIGWYVSVLTPPGQGPEVPILLAALCGICAQAVFPPEVLKVAEERRQQLLQAKAR